MNDAEFEVMVRAGDALKAARLLRYLAEHRQHAVEPKSSDQARVLWLAKELLASRRGAQTVDMHDRIVPERPLPGQESNPESSFSEEQALYSEYRRYSGAKTPDEHARWVDKMIDVLGEFYAGRPWPELDEETKTVADEQLQPLLRRMLQAADRFDGVREPHHFAA
jgi:hypothetical protein